MKATLVCRDFTDTLSFFIYFLTKKIILKFNETFDKGISCYRRLQDA